MSQWTSAGPDGLSDLDILRRAVTGGMSIASAAPLIGATTKEAAALCREHNIAPGVEAGTRECASCRRPFHSVHRTNRMCRRCKFGSGHSKFGLDRRRVVESLGETHG